MGILSVRNVGSIYVFYRGNFLPFIFYENFLYKIWII